MKLRYKILFIAIALIGLSSCKDFLEKVPDTRVYLVNLDQLEQLLVLRKVLCGKLPREVIVASKSKLDSIGRHHEYCRKNSLQQQEHHPHQRNERRNEPHRAHRSQTQWFLSVIRLVFHMLIVFLCVYTSYNYLTPASSFASFFAVVKSALPVPSLGTFSTWNASEGNIIGGKLLARSSESTSFGSFSPW